MNLSGFGGTDASRQTEEGSWGFETAPPRLEGTRSGPSNLAGFLLIDATQDGNTLNLPSSETGRIIMRAILASVLMIATGVAYAQSVQPRVT
jgi:hypothetical protein